MNRRTLATSAPLAVLALAGCSTIQSVTGAPTAAVQAVLNEVQYVLPLLDAMATGIAIAVPGAATAMSLVEGYLTQAEPLFQQIVVTMSTATAQPIVTQIETYLSSAVSAVAQAVAANASLAKYATQVSEARAVLALVEAFVNGVVAGNVKAVAPVRFLHG
jgi:hypothetical protein